MNKLQPIQISIPQPCHKDWNKMTPTEQGRFCNTCQKCVVDFTDFSNKQLFEYFNAHKGQKICGRFENKQLNRTIHVPPQPQSLLYKYFIALGLTLVMMQVPQQNVSAKTPYIQTQIVSDNPIADKLNNKDSIVINGRVLDKYKEPLIGAFIQLKLNDQTIATTTCDEEGNYALTIDQYKDGMNLFILYNGFKRATIKLTKNNISQFHQTTMEAAPPLDILGVVDYRVPLIDPFNPSNRTFTSDEIEKMPR